MKRRSTRYAAGLAIFLLIASIAPGAAARPGGKKALGTISSFDGTTLTVALADGSSYTGEVSPTAKIKVEHRGAHARGRGHGNPTRGCITDLEAGVLVLRLKERKELITKIRIRMPAQVPSAARRSPGEEAPASRCGDSTDAGKDADDADDEGPEDDAGARDAGKDDDHSDDECLEDTKDCEGPSTT